MPEFAPVAVAKNYLAGRAAAQDEQTGDIRNQLGQQTLQQNALAQQQQQAALSADQQKQVATRLMQAAQYGIQSATPKQFIEQNYPELAQAAGPQWATADDNAVRQELQGLVGKFGPQAGIGPAVQPPEEFGTTTQEIVRNGKPVAVQLGKRGTVREIPGATPYNKPTQADSAASGGPKFRPLTPEEYTQYGLPTGTTAQIDTSTGKIDLINRPTNASAGRPIPSAVVKGLVENRTNVGKIDRALTAIDAYPDAFGASNYWGDTIRQRTDPKGVDARAKVADIGSLLIHDRSGAAVTVAEMPRLAPFIPQATDSAAVVKTKLSNLKANIEAIQDETQSIYSPEAGYKELPNALPSVPAAPAAPQAAAPAQGQRLTPQQAAALPPNTPFIGMDGVQRVHH